MMDHMALIAGVITLALALTLLLVAWAVLS